MNTKGVFDQGVREWVRHVYQSLVDSGRTHEEAERLTEIKASQTFGAWRTDATPTGGNQP